MSRLFMTGFEASQGTASGNEGLAENPSGANWNPSNFPYPGITTTNARTGLCAACATDAGVTSYGQWFEVFTGATARDYFLRFYFRKSANPTTACPLAYLAVASTIAGICYTRLNTNGTLSLLAADGTTVLGTGTTALANDTYYRIEMRVRVGTTSTGQAELQLNGLTEIAAVSNANLGTTAPAGFVLGTTTNTVAMGTGVIFYYDDVAINDGLGTDQNSWPGDGKIVNLFPISDSAVGTGWTLGTGTATGGNAWTAVDNRPPTGVADLAVGSDPKQIRNATANANTAYSATMQSYTTAGVGSSDTIKVLQAAAVTAAPSTTSAKTGSIRILSNPVDPGLVSFGNFLYGAVVAGTYPSGWGAKFGAIYDRSNANLAALTSANYGTSPVMSINQVTSSTRIAMVALMRIQVEYGFVAAASPRRTLMGVGS